MSKSYGKRPGIFTFYALPPSSVSRGDITLIVSSSSSSISICKHPETIFFSRDCVLVISEADITITGPSMTAPRRSFTCANNLLWPAILLPTINHVAQHVERYLLILLRCGRLGGSVRQWRIATTRWWFSHWMFRECPTINIVFQRHWERYTVMVCSCCFHRDWKVVWRESRAKADSASLKRHGNDGWGEASIWLCLRLREIQKEDYVRANGGGGTVALVSSVRTGMAGVVQCLREVIWRIDDRWSIRSNHRSIMYNWTSPKIIHEIQRLLLSRSRKRYLKINSDIF